MIINYAKLESLHRFQHSWNDVLIVAMAGQNFITTYLVIQKSKEIEGIFPIMVMISFVFRLLVAMMMLLIVWMLEVDQLETFAINLVVLYLVFLAFELYSLLTNLRPNSE